MKCEKCQKVLGENLEEKNLVLSVVKNRQNMLIDYSEKTHWGEATTNGGNQCGLGDKMTFHTSP